MKQRLLFFIFSIFFSVISKAQENKLLFEAVEKNDIETVKKLLEQGANPNSIDEYGDAVLMSAALYASVDCMKLLLDKGADPNFKNKEAGTALMFCVHDIEKTKLLISKGADVNATAKSGNTALFIAVVGYNNYELVKMLIDQGADPKVKNRLNETALIRAAALSDANVLELLKSKGIPLDSIASTGTALTVSLLNSNHEASMALLELGADPNAVDTYGIPLIAAVFFDDTLAILQLIKKTKDINALDIDGISPLAWACYNEHDRIDIIQALIDHGANVNQVFKNGSTPLSWALQKGNTKTVELLKKSGAKK